MVFGSSAAMQDLNSSIEAISKNYSTDMKIIIITLLSKPTTIQEICSLISLKVIEEMDKSLQ
jgi:hypothetical protein